MANANTKQQSQSPLLHILTARQNQRLNHATVTANYTGQCDVNNNIATSNFNPINYGNLSVI